MNRTVFRNPFMIFAAAFSVLMLVISMFVGFSGLEGIEGKLIINIDPLNSPVLASASVLMSIFGILAAIVIINAVLVYEIYARERFISYILSSSSMVAATLTLVATIMIASLN